LPTPTPDAGIALDRSRYRSAMVAGAVVLGYVVLGVRAVPLMLMPDDRLEAKAAVQFHEAVEIEAPRGDILARDGTILATTVQMPEVHADPSRLPPDQVDALATDIAILLNLDRADVHERLSRSSRRDVLIARQVSPEVESQLLELEPGGVLFTRVNPTRYYPGRELGAQVLGVVGANGKGVEGIERQLDSDLRGSTFRYVQERDRKGRAISTQVEARGRAHAGDTVTLTLDPHIQWAAEDALDAIMEESAPHSATAVVLDVQTGEILALANRPVTNVNDRAKRDMRKLRNHGVADAHEPGSVVKPFVVALAIEDGIVRPDTLVDCEGGYWRIGRSRIRDDHAHDVVTVSEVVKYSSNIGTAKLAFQLGPDRVMGGLQEFGFASSTHAGLPGEVSGFLRDPSTVKNIELATTAFGQGMTATALQLASALQTLGNDGERMQPYIVSEIRDRLGQVDLSQEPTSLGQVVSPDTATMTLTMMASVLDEGGTGKRARIPGYTAAGKTGTAQKVVDGGYSPTARVASFMGVAPATNPRIAIVVMVDTPTEGSRYGGTVSGPAFAHIGEVALKHLGVPQDRLEPEDPDELTEPLEDDAIAWVDVEAPALTWTSDGTLRVPDLSGLSMRDVLQTVDGAGLELALSGSGQVVEQDPQPGQPLAPGDRLQVHLN
jgi:cell division protein FtsI (penicillin-binding protein 3)